jgi:hypothetical protein
MWAPSSFSIRLRSAAHIYRLASARSVTNEVISMDKYMKDVLETLTDIQERLEALTKKLKADGWDMDEPHPSAAEPPRHI